MSKASVKRSKQLSWLLRHGAIETGLAMDKAGWVDVADVLATLEMSYDELLSAVATNDKGRLQLTDARVRACQGHSLAGVPVTCEALERSWQTIAPTESLWHGTNAGAIAGIAEHGITAGQRTHVHLARQPDSHVGKRARVDLLLEVSPSLLDGASLPVFEAPNGVILVRHVPVSCIVGVRAGNATATKQADEALTNLRRRNP
jgi:putative RNA 2'-phosphotransferase